MNEIDDDYDSGVDLLDQTFFESLEKGANKEAALVTYLKRLDALRAKREHEYQTKIDKERKSLLKKKKVQKNKEQYDRLRVIPFSFAFTAPERMRQRFDVHGFRFKRFILVFFWNSMPRSVLRYYYSFKKDLKTLYEELINFTIGVRTKIKQLFKRIWIGLWSLMKSIGKGMRYAILWALAKTIFYRKKKEEKGSDAVNEASKEASKTEEDSKNEEGTEEAGKENT